MTTDGEAEANTQGVTEADLVKLREPLSKPKDFFESSKKHPILHVPPENRDRKYALYGCEKIVFEGEDGESIWITDGEMEMMLPKGVGFKIQNGKARELLI